MSLFRHATSVYGQTVLVGASWDLIWWFVGAGAAFILVHAAVTALTGTRARVSERVSGER